MHLIRKVCSQHGIVSRILFFAGIILGVWIFSWFVFQGWSKINYTYALNLGEPPLAQAIELMRNGINPYKTLENPPFTLMPYGPVYPLICVFLKNFAGGYFSAARFLTSASTLAVSTLIGMFAFKRSGSLTAGIVFACTYLVMPIIQKWGFQVNVDMTALSIELMAFLFFLKFDRIRHHRFLFAAIAFQTAAFFTKSSAIAAGASFALWYLFRRDWKVFLTYSFIQAACLLICFLILDYTTAGGYYFHTVFEIGNRLFFPQLISRFWTDYISQYWLLLTGLTAAVAGMIFRKQMTLPVLALMVSAGLTVSLGKQGSDTNYFLGFTAYMMIVLAQSIPSGKLLKYLYLLPVSIYLLLAMPVNLNYVRAEKERVRVNTEFYGRFSDLIRNAKGPVISWDMSLLLANNRPIYFEAFPMAQMGYSGVWDQQPILKAIQDKQIALMVLYFLTPVLKGDRNFTPEFINALAENYQPIGTVKTPWEGTPYWFFYVPKKIQEAQ